jgi:hypothetical protein
MHNSEIDKKIVLNDFNRIKVEADKVDELIFATKSFQDFDKVIEQITLTQSLLKNLVKFLQSFPDQNKGVVDAIRFSNIRVANYDNKIKAIRNKQEEIRKKYGEKGISAVLVMDKKE